MTDSNDTMIRVQRTTVERINALKSVRRETQDEVVQRALDALEAREREQVPAR